MGLGVLVAPHATRDERATVPRSSPGTRSRRAIARQMVQFAHENYITLGALVQLARLLITKPHEASQRPLTTALVLLYGAVGAAVATGRLSVDELRLDEALLATEPWRVIGCLLAYERASALACHLWLLLVLGSSLEHPGQDAGEHPRGFGSRFVASVLLFCVPVTLVLRSVALQPEFRPDLLAAAPLFSLALLYARLHTLREAAHAESALCHRVAL